MKEHTGKPINLMNLTREDLVSTGGAWRDDWVKTSLQNKQICQLGVVPPPVSIPTDWIIPVSVLKMQ